MLLIKNKQLRQIAGLLETFNVLTLKLMLRNPGAVRTFPGYLFRDYMRAVGKDTWRCEDIFDIVDIPDGARVVLEHIPGEGIDTHLDELAYMALVTKAIARTRIFEIGTFRGRTALNFAINAPCDCQVFTLDLPPEERAALMAGTNDADATIIAMSETGADYKGKPESSKITQLFGSSTEFDFSPYEGNIDLVFVDGAHNYDVVLIDTQNALKMVRPGGAIMWHDWANYGDYNDVIRAVLDILPGNEIIQINNSQLAFYRKPTA